MLATDDNHARTLQRRGVVVVGGVIARGLWTGALAGFVVGFGDAMLSFGALRQFLPGVGGGLECAVFTGSLYAFVLGIVGAVVAGLAALVWRGSALGPLLRHGHAHHTATRAADPRRALTGLG